MKEKTGGRIKNLILSNRLVLAAFFLPALIMAVAFATMGVFPFGNQQIAVIDFYHQYLPLIEEMQYKMQHGESLFYTWNGAGGCNFWNIIAYQAASPFNLLLIIVPEKWLVEALTAFLVIRTGLAGSFMFYFLKKTYSRATFATVGFSSLYALCAYVVAYYWNIMWMDAVMLLPLCILGLARLIDGGRGTLYTVVLAIIVFSNYYIGILVCIFILTYYFALYFGRKREGGFRTFVCTSVRAAFYSALALAMSAVMLLPTWISMQKSSAMNSEFPDYAFMYDDPLDILNQLLPLSKNCYMEGVPNIGCGLAVVICLIFYFICRNIGLRSKITNALYLTFIFFSLNVNYLDFIWHGFHYPNMLPYRFAFAVSFVLVGMAYEAFINLDRIEIRHMWIAFAGMVAYYLFAEKVMPETVDDANTFFYFGVTLLALYTFLFVAYRKGILRSRTFRYVFVALVAAELSCVVITNVNMIGSTDKEEYNENAEDVAKAVKQIDDEFCRVELDDQITLNEPARFHYRGMTQFASSINSVTNGLYEKIGLEADPGGNRVSYTLNNPVTNAMLNIGYVIAKHAKLQDDDFTFLKKYNNTRLYESKYPLSIGYMLPGTIHTWNPDSSNPFINLNDYVRAATGNKYDDLFYRIEEESVRGIDSKIKKTGEDNYTVSADNGGTGEIRYRYKSERTGKYYIYVEAESAEYVTYERSVDKCERDIDPDYGAIVNIGKIKKGDTFDVDIQYEYGTTGTAKCIVCYMDEDKWDKAYKMISSDMMKVTGCGSTWLNGEIEVDDIGVLVTSIPYDEGWTMKVDGKDREITDLVGDAWISTPLTPGKHVIELSFRPPGIIIGLIITLLSVILLIVTHIWGRRIVEQGRRMLARPEDSASPEEDQPVNDISDLF